MAGKIKNNNAAKRKSKKEISKNPNSKIQIPKSNIPKSKLRNPQLAALRKQAEKKLAKQTERLHKLSTQDIEHLIHELGTHQIELEMQNEELRRAQEELEASRSRYSDLYDFAPVGYFTFNENGLILEANLTAARELGMERGHIIKQPFRVFIITKDRTIFDDHLREVFKSESRQTCEVRLKRKSGIEFHVRLESILVQDLNGNNVCRTSLIDITENKKIETLLKEERDFISAVLSTEGALVVVLDLQGRIVSFNKTSELITGYSFDEVKGKHLSDYLLIPEKGKAVKSVFKELKAGQYPNKHENYWVTKDGRHRLISWSNTSLLDNNGKVKYVIGTGIDITEFKRAEDETKRFASFPQLSPNPVLEVDTSGTIVFCNAATVLTLRKLDIRDTTVFLPDDITNILKALEEEKEIQFYREVKIKDRIFGEVLYLTPQFNSVRIYANNITERKAYQEALKKALLESRQHEEALRHSEEYFRLLMENASDAVTILEGDGTIRYESLSVERILGYKPEELVGTSAFDLIHPDDVLNAKDTISQLLQKPGLALHAEFRCRHKDGSWRILGATGRNLLDHPVIKGIIVNSRDITNRVQAEKEVRSERQKLINILDSMVDGVYIVDQKYNIEYVNPELEKEYGPVKGRSCYDYFEGRKKACTWCKNQEVFEGSTIRGEWYSSKTNRIYDLISTPLRNPDGSVSKLGIFRDITERKQAEQALRESEEKFRTIFDGSIDGILIADIESKKFLMGNNAICNMLGYSKDEIKNLAIMDIHPQDDLPVIEKRFEEMARGEVISNENIQVKRKDGSIFDVDINSAPITLSGKKYIVGSFRDITERKRAEESLKKVNRTLKALSKSDQAMLHAKSESEFLKDVCEIVVEDCGHAMVWIGFAEDNEGKTVRPVASAGFEEGYLETLNITWADTERGRGPTGTAIRTGRPSICRNMLTDPAFELWREEAIKRGYASSIVLPLMSDNKAFGAINIYSREPDPFTENEVKLLSELAGDLSYGILAMRSRVAHIAAEEAVKQSEERYRTLAAATFEGIAVNERGWFVDANDQLLQMLGYTRDELIGLNVEEMLPPEERERVMVNMREGRESHVEHQMFRKDGSRIIVEAHGRTIIEEEKPVRFTAIRDITERKQAEEKLREAKDLSDALNRINETISLTLDIDGIMRRVVAETSGAIGCETSAISLRKDDRWEVRYVYGLSQELIGTEMVDEQGPHAIFALENRKPVAINDIYKDERVNQEHMKKYGVRSVLVIPLFAGDEPLGVIYCNYHSSPVQFTAHQIDFATKLGVSVSLAIEKARLMNTLELRAAELEVVNRELEAFSYTISHDLKSPLRSIQGFAQAITEDYKDRLGDEGKNFLDRINSAGERMTEFIDAMLEMSRLTSRDVMNKSVDLSSIAEMIAYEMKTNEPDRLVHFIIAKKVRVQGDEDLLEIVLRNLFDNAWKFTSKHASAKIEFGASQMRNSECGMRNEKYEMEGKLVCFVKDDGAGFNMEYADKLFMPFKRLHSASEFPGLGIGLATVKKIISKHGGKIWAEGEPEKGATFYFTLG